MSSNLTFGLGDLPTTSPLLLNATGSASIQLIPVTQNLTEGPIMDFTTVRTSNWTYSLNVSTDPLEESAYTGLSISWPSGDGPGDNSEEEEYWKACAVVLPDLFSTYNEDGRGELGQGSCGTLLGKECDTAIGVSVALEFMGLENACKLGEAHRDIETGSRCESVLGKSRNITAYVVPLKKNRDTISWYHDDLGGSNASLAKAMERHWPVYVTEVPKEDVPGRGPTQFYKCFRAENFTEILFATPTANSTEDSESDSKNAASLAVIGQRSIYILLLSWVWLLF